MRFVRQNVRDIWPDIKEPIFNMLQGFDERPEDIYAACVSGRLHVFTCPDGFIVCQEVVQAFTGIKELFVWFCQSHSPNVSVLKEYDSDIRELAEAIGATKIAFATNRRGFDKALGPQWRTRSVIYETEV